MRGKGPAMDRRELEPGKQIDVWTRPKTKMIPGWQGPARSVENSEEGNVTVKWQGRVMSVPNHLCSKDITIKYSDSKEIAASKGIDNYLKIIAAESKVYLEDQSKEEE